jgi:hypothetical protein
MSAETTNTIAPFYQQGNFTMVHNVIFDYVMPRVKPNSFKLLMLVLRETNGRQRSSEAISYEDIKRMTGMGGKSTVSAAISELMDMGILLAKAGKTNDAATRYALNRKWRCPSPETGLNTSPEIELSPEMGLPPSPEIEPHTNTFIPIGTIEGGITLNGEGVSTPPSSSKPVSEANGKTRRSKETPPPPDALPLDDAMYAAVRKALGVTAASTPKAENDALEATHALNRANRPVAEVEQFAKNWWGLSFWGRNAKITRRPRADEIRDSFDEILMLSQRSPGQSTSDAELAQIQAKYTNNLTH